MALRPDAQSSGMSAGMSPLTRTGCASDAMPPADADPRHSLGELRLAAKYVALGGFVQIVVEGLTQVGDVALLDQDLGEVRASGHAAAARLGLCERDVEAELLKAGDQAHVAVSARRLLAGDPIAELVQIFVAEEISQQVRGVAVQLGGKFDAADQFEARLGGHRQRLIVALERIVIRDAERGHPGANRFRHQLRGRTGAVGFVSVRVEIDQS